MAVVGILLSTIGLPLPPGAIDMIVNLIMTYIAGQSAVDAVEKYKV